MPRRRSRGEGHIRRRVTTREDGSKYTRWSAIVTLGIDPASGKQQIKEGPARKTEKEAKADLKALTTARDEGRLEAATMTVGAYLDYWFAEHKAEIRPRTQSTYESVIRLHLKPRLKDVKLAQLTPVLCQRTQSAIAEAVSPATARKCRQALHAALEQAVKWELLNRNPLALVKAIRAPRAELDQWTPQDAATFLKAAKDDPLYPLFYLVIATGLRAGEFLGLKWEDIKGSVLHIQRQISTVGKPDEGPTKTARSVRKLRLDAGTLAVLGVHRAKQNEHKAGYSGTYRDSGYIFAARNGSSIRLENVRNRHFNPLLEAANVPRIRLHDLRHFAASRWIELGVDPAEVSRRLGHSRNSTTMDIYVHALKDPEENVLSMDDMLGQNDGEDEEDRGEDAA